MDAARPTEFVEDRQSISGYIAIPKISSERRAVIPIGFKWSGVIVASELPTVVGAIFFHFGVPTRTMHMAWVKFVPEWARRMAAIHAREARQC